MPQIKSSLFLDWLKENCPDLLKMEIPFANIIGYLKGTFESLSFRPAILAGAAATEETNKLIEKMCLLAFDNGRKVIELEAKVRELEEKLKQA